jgi:hypothetical protein
VAHKTIDHGKRSSLICGNQGMTKRRRNKTVYSVKRSPRTLRRGATNDTELSLPKTSAVVATVTAEERSPAADSSMATGCRACTLDAPANAFCTREPLLSSDGLGVRTLSPAALVDRHRPASDLHMTQHEFSCPPIVDGKHLEATNMGYVKFTAPTGI